MLLYTSASECRESECNSKFPRVWSQLNDDDVMWLYLRPVSGCTSGACETAAAAAAAAAEDGDGCLGLLTLVLLLANSSLMVWGKSGSKRTPCCKRWLPFMHQQWKQVLRKLKKKLTEKVAVCSSCFNGQNLECWCTTSLPTATTSKKFASSSYPEA